AANIGNVYMSGLSLVNSVPRFGRFRATVAVAAAAVCLSAFPDVVNRASTWITHLGNIAAPLTGVILADYLVAKRRRLDVPALFDSGGRYRYLRGVNVAAFGAVALGVAVYYALPQTSVKVIWGIVAAAVAYLALRRLQERPTVAATPTAGRPRRWASQAKPESIRLRRSGRRGVTLDSGGLRDLDGGRFRERLTRRPPRRMETTWRRRHNEYRGSGTDDIRGSCRRKNTNANLEAV